MSTPSRRPVRGLSQNARVPNGGAESGWEPSPAPPSISRYLDNQASMSQGTMLAAAARAPIIGLRYARCRGTSSVVVDDVVVRAADRPEGDFLSHVGGDDPPQSARKASYEA